MKKKNNNLLETILYEISKDYRTTEKSLAEKYNLSERTIRRYFKILKNENKILYINNPVFKGWVIITDILNN